MKDALIDCYDGMTGLPRDHLLSHHRPDLRRAPDPPVNEVRALRRWRNIAACLRSFCNAPTADPALAAREEFIDREWGQR